MSDNQENDDEGKRPGPPGLGPGQKDEISKTNSSNLEDGGASGGLDEVPLNVSSSSSTSTSSGGFVSDLLSKLNISASSKKETRPKILEEASLEGIKKYIESGNCKNIVVMAGAGISTSAGIPDFRSPGSGLYDAIKERYNLDNPQVMFEIGFFKNNPKPFYTLAKELLPEILLPTPSHHFIKLLHSKGLLLRHYTQNIDGLERRAGLPDDKIVEAHGSFYKSHCLKCEAEYTFEWLKDKIKNEIDPSCTKCQGIVKPDVVFFGENLPPRFFMCAANDFKTCDLLIIMGTSLAVQPFASLIDKARDDCPRLLINREKVGSEDSSFLASLRRKFSGQKNSGGIDLDSLGHLFGGGGFNFDDERNRDVALVGDCDDGIIKLAAALGWEKDLEKLIVAPPREWI